MMTFLPSINLYYCARVLDRARLGKQRVECYQILETLSGRSESWKNHPIMRMWKGYEECLKLYMNFCMLEWEERGYKNIKLKLNILDNDKRIYPPWFGREDIHSSHRATLLSKDYEWYKQFNWKEEPKYGYVWV